MQGRPTGFDTTLVAPQRAMISVHSPNVLVGPTKSPSVQGVFLFPDQPEEKFPLHTACRDGKLARVSHLLAHGERLIPSRTQSESRSLGRQMNTYPFSKSTF